MSLVRVWPLPISLNTSKRQVGGLAQSHLLNEGHLGLLILADLSPLAWLVWYESA